MAKILIENQSLTQDQLLTTLQRTFGDRYDVRYSKYPAVKMAVKKSRWCAIAVRKIKQLPRGTEVTYNPFVPSFLINMMFGGAILQLFMRSSFKALAHEFAEGLKDPSKAAVAGSPPAAPSAQPANPLREAGWMAAAALFALALPSLVFGYWYFPRIIAGTIVTAIVAFGLSFIAPGARGNATRGAFVGLGSGMVGMLAGAMTVSALAWEIGRWTTPVGLFQLVVFAASGAFMARSQRSQSAVDAAATSGASA